MASSHTKMFSCLCAHDVRIVAQRSCRLCSDSRSSIKRFVEVVGKSKSGSWFDDFSDNVIFQFDITRCFSYVVVAISMLRIFGNTIRFDRVGSISLICNVVNLTRVTCRCNPQIHEFAPCSKDLALVAKLMELRTTCSWDPRFESCGILNLWLINFLSFWDYDCFQKKSCNRTTFMYLIQKCQARFEPIAFLYGDDILSNKPCCQPDLKGMYASLIIKTTSSVQFTTVHTNLIEQTTNWTHGFETSHDCCHQERFHMFITTPIGATSTIFWCQKRPTELWLNLRILAKILL